MTSDNNEIERENRLSEEKIERLKKAKKNIEGLKTNYDDWVHNRIINYLSDENISPWNGNCRDKFMNAYRNFSGGASNNVMKSLNSAISEIGTEITNEGN